MLDQLLSDEECPKSFGVVGFIAKERRAGYSAKQKRK